MTRQDAPIICPLQNAATDVPHHPAILWGSRRISFYQLHVYVQAAVRSLKERGIRAGHRVAIIGGNSVEAVIVLLGLWRLGAVAVPVNPGFPLPQIRKIITALDIRAVVSSLQKGGLPAKVHSSHFEITDLIVFEHKEVFADIRDVLLTFDTDQPAAIVLTSGSTGEPKAAMLSFGNLYFSALGSNELIPLSSDGKWLLSLPLFHVSGLGIVMRCLLSKAAIVIANREEHLGIVREGKVSHVSLVLTQLTRLLEGGFKRPDGLKVVLLGGGAFPAAILKRAIGADLPVYLSYGLTEMASQVATGKVCHMLKPCARLLPYREMRIDMQGEICVRGRTLFLGYLGEKGVQRPLDNEGWFHTGDLGHIDTDGCLTVTGRKDDMFISGGENIHPREIESVMLKIDGVSQAVVVPIKDDVFGHRPVAFIRWDHNARVLAETDLNKILSNDLPKFKVPVAYYPWPTPPENSDQKMNRAHFKNIVDSSQGSK